VGKPLGQLTAGLPLVVAAVVRQGLGILPESELTLAEGDLLMVSASPTVIEHLRARMEGKR
jgi:Trk K+ transport system NAD-binding subunit